MTMECLKTIFEMIFDTAIAMKGYFLLLLAILFLSYFI